MQTSAAQWYTHLQPRHIYAQNDPLGSHSRPRTSPPEIPRRLGNKRRTVGTRGIGKSKTGHLPLWWAPQSHWTMHPSTVSRPWCDYNAQYCTHSRAHSSSPRCGWWSLAQHPWFRTESTRHCLRQVYIARLRILHSQYPCMSSLPCTHTCSRRRSRKRSSPEQGCKVYKLRYTYFALRPTSRRHRSYLRIGKHRRH